MLDLASFNLTFLRHELYWAANPGNLIAVMVPKTKDPRVHLVGYGPSASTIGANRAGAAAASELMAFLGLP